MEVNINGAMTHCRLLKLLIGMELSLPTARRIIDRVNQTPIEEVMPLEEEYISLLQQCQTEQEVLEKLDEKGW